MKELMLQTNEGMLLLLPDFIRIRVITDWVHIIDIAHLDAAYCNRALRPLFHNVLKHPRMVVNNLYDITIGLEWFHARGLKSSTFISHRQISSFSAVIQYLATEGGENFQTIHMSNGAQYGSVLLSVFSFICKRVRHVDIQNSATLLYLDLLIRQCRATLVSIRIVDCVLDSCQALDGLHLPHLRRLSLFMDAPVEVLAKFLKLSDQLEHVHIKKALFDSSCADLLQTSTNIVRTLDLITCQGLSGGVLNKLAMGAAGLQILALHQCAGVTEQSLISFVEHCPQLVSILFTGLVTDITLIAIAEHCGPRMRHLALAQVQGTSDAGIDAMAQRCTNIESLWWASTGASMPALLCGFIRAQSQLREVSFGGCNVDDRLLEAAAETHGMRLTYLSLYNTTGYTERGLWDLAKQCTELRQVDIESNSTLITVKDRGWWQIMRPGIAFVDENSYPPHWTKRWR